VSSAPHDSIPPVQLVLLPGMDGTEVLFGPLLRNLPDWLRPTVVCYSTEGRNGYEDLLPKVLHVIDALPRCVVLGWSFSGPLALRVANQRPDRVRAVILCSTFVRAPLAWMPPLRALLRTPVVGAMRFLRRLPLWLGRPPDDPLRRDKAILWQRVPARTLAARARAIAAVDARKDLRDCTRPILYLAASDDTVVPPANLAEVLRERPAVQVATIAGNHFALYANPEAAVTAIEPFVRSLANGSS
jgi:pimeloyl-[acyl-carrier protein] methyl ester esterase